MSACLEMQSFSLASWSTHRQTKTTPDTLWWDFFKLFGVLWHCCNPNYAPQGRDTPHSMNAMYLGFTQAISATPSHEAGIRDRSTCTCRPPWCPCANSAAVLGTDWSAAALPWHYSPYTNPFLSNKPHFLMLVWASSLSEVGGMGHHPEAFQKPPSSSNCSL